METGKQELVVSCIHHFIDLRHRTLCSCRRTAGIALLQLPQLFPLPLLQPVPKLAEVQPHQYHPRCYHSPPCAQIHHGVNASIAESINCLLSHAKSSLGNAQL
jgi:hypothetical protein